MIYKTLPALALLLNLAAPVSAHPVGLKTAQVHAPHHGRDMNVSLFYPAAPTDLVTTRVAENAVFFGHDVYSDAAVRQTCSPIILMSHGLGGLTRSLTWLATGLAERGAVVIGVDHPNSSFGDFDMRAGLDHWTRAQDLQVALDAMLVHPDFHAAYHRCTTEPRVYATGFSYGGWTALSLGGLRGDATAYAQYCARTNGGSSHCNDLAHAKVDLGDVDPQKWQASYRDTRIQAVAAIDPGLTYDISQEQADGLVIPSLLITLGDETQRLSATDISPNGSNLIEKLGNVQTLTISPASHFTALPRCKPIGATLLKEDNDDPVCTDPKGTDRAAVHSKIVKAIADHFEL